MVISLKQSLNGQFGGIPGDSLVIWKLLSDGLILDLLILGGDRGALYIFYYIENLVNNKIYDCWKK